MNPHIRRYIDRAPEAISGSGGHLTTLRVARCLYNGFGLSCQQVFECLQAYNSRLADKWTDGELRHKAQSAANGTYDKPSGWMFPATDATANWHSQSSAPPRETVVLVPKYPPAGVKKAEKYVFATDATAPSYSQSSFTRARAHARASLKSEISVASVPESGEAKRIAGELVKLHRDGAFADAHDPEARFYAVVLHTFGGTYEGKRTPENL